MNRDAVYATRRVGYMKPQRYSSQYADAVKAPKWDSLAEMMRLLNTPASPHRTALIAACRATAHLPLRHQERTP